MSTTDKTFQNSKFKLNEHIETTYTFQDREVEHEHYRVLMHLYDACDMIEDMKIQADNESNNENKRYYYDFESGIKYIYSRLGRVTESHTKMLNKANAVRSDYEHDILRKRHVVDITVKDYDEAVDIVIERLSKRYPRIDFRCLYIMKAPSNTKNAAKGGHAPSLTYT